MQKNQNDIIVVFYKGYARTCNVEKWNSFIPELQLEDTESVIKMN